MDSVPRWPSSTEWQYCHNCRSGPRPPSPTRSVLPTHLPWATRSVSRSRRWFDRAPGGSRAGDPQGQLLAILPFGWRGL